MTTKESETCVRQERDIVGTSQRAPDTAKEDDRLSSSPASVIAPAPTRPSTPENPASTLLTGIRKRIDSGDSMTFVMFVRVRDGKPEIVPLPELANLWKIHENFGKLSKRVQASIIRNIPEEERKACGMLFDWLSVAASKATDSHKPAFSGTKQEERENGPSKDAEAADFTKVDFGAQR